MNEQNENKRVALFAGSFDPFTMGHHRIVQRALNMFDTVVVAVGHNMGKDTMFPTEKRVADIRALYKDDNRVQVLAYSGLTVDFAKSVGAACLLRGVRSVKDFEYERDLADINLRLSGMETLFLVSEPQYAAISSSVVRELLAYGKDVSAFMPFE
ncbi:MAG: pantetheine-phosphate adenylyltransferase [Bacteroidaceae bacterium]|nr:pantetheine-phosphate adenylyltransferase [Bacteroidaceae bacterium]MBQ3623328.1 pantetheine-phosphate adenylyltransferase [Bacteroidaceae bacterium]